MLTSTPLMTKNNSLQRVGCTQTIFHYITCESASDDFIAATWDPKSSSRKSSKGRDFKFLGKICIKNFVE